MLYKRWPRLHSGAAAMVWLSSAAHYVLTFFLVESYLKEEGYKIPVLLFLIQ